MALDYLSSDQSKRNHKIAIIVETSAALAALALMFWAISSYWISPKKDAVVSIPVDPYEKKLDILSQPNPQVELTSEEIVKKKAILNQPNPTVILTPEQIRRKQSILENI